MGRLDLKLLGVPQAILDGRRRDFRIRKALALLAYLAVEGGMHRRDELAEFLWPGSRGGRGRTTLRSALARIRRALDQGEQGETGSGVGPSESGFLLIDGDMVGLRLGPEVGLDLDILREAYLVARTTVDETNGATREDLISTLRSTEAACRSEFMEGFELEDAPEFDLWLEAQRATWRSRHGTVMARLFELEYDAGEFATAAGTAERWVWRDPTNETAWVGLMEARSMAGDPQGALDAYEEYSRKLRWLELDPGSEAEALSARVQEQVHAARKRENRVPLGPLTMPFTGRAADFGALVKEYRAAGSGAARAVAVTGEAGIGKTRLVEEFLGWAASRGADALSSRALETGTQPPYGSLIDALRPRLERERAPDDLLDDSWLAELARILPELRDRYPDLPPPAADVSGAQALLHEAVARLGAALARSGGLNEPLVVFLDDLQWSDRATLDALRYACRSWTREGVPVLLVVSAREEDLESDALGGWFPSLRRELPVRRLALSPMKEDDIHGLLRLLVEVTGQDRDENPTQLEELGRWLLGQSDGHPLFLAQIVGALLDRGVLVERTGPDGRRKIVLSGERFDEAGLRGLVPAGLRELILEKLRPLPAHASDMLAAGAVLGGDFGFESLLTVAGLGETEGLSALDGLVLSRLIEEAKPAQPGAYYSFTHDKVREVAYTEAGEARREVFHRRALEYLQERGAPAAELAGHALAARALPEACGHLVAAAEEAMVVFAARDAIGYYERAQELLADPQGGTPTIGTPEERVRLFERLGHAYELLGDLARALEAYERVLAEARAAGDPEAEWTALFRLALLGTESITRPEEEGDLYRGVSRRSAATRDGGVPVGARAGADAGDGTPNVPNVFAWSPSYSRARVEEALSLARTLGPDELIAPSLVGFGAVEATAGRWAKAADAAEEALTIYARLGDRAMEAEMLDFIATAEVMTGSPSDAVHRMRRHPGLTGELGDLDIHRADVHGFVLGLVETGGDYGEALSAACAGAKAARSLGYPIRLLINLVRQGDTYLALLALEEARAVYEEMARIAPRTAFRAIGFSKLCAVAALSGDWPEACEMAVGAAQSRGEVVLQESEPLHRHLEVEALLRGGEEALAREELESFGEAVGENQRFYLAYLRSAAVFARWKGDADKTLSHLREAQVLAERFELPGEIWQVCTTIGEVHEGREEAGPSARAFGRAAAVIRGLAEKMSDQDLRRRYLAAPQTSRVLEKAQARKA